MTADSGLPTPRYAFFLNGSNFACEVLQALLQRQAAPAYLVLPEYAPAATPESSTLEPVDSQPQSRLMRLAGTTPIAYAPKARQAQCAQWMRQNTCDFLLVACWPYLISAELLSSVTRAAVNLHPSFLPWYRGPDPVAEQFGCDEPRPGVSLHLLNQEFDGGDIVAQARLADAPTLNTRSRFEHAAAQLGSDLFLDAINRYDAGWQTRRQVLPAGP